MLTSRQIKVLIVDDDEDDFFIISDYILGIDPKKFIIDWCNNYTEAANKIAGKQYDIYFVDYRLGNRTGLDLLQETYSAEFDDPIVLLTGKGNKEIDIKAMLSGATDYLIKSELNTEKLERCIRYSLDRSDSIKELKARENRYRNLFEGSKDAIFIANEQLVFSEVNHAASEIFSYKMKDLIGHDLYEFIKASAEKEKLVQLLKNNENIDDHEIDIINKNNEIRSCLLSISFLQDSLGNPLVHGFLHDITNSKKAELANLQAQKLVANERLMRTLAHEIRNPLNNISLSVDHFEKIYDANGKDHDLIDIIQRNCLRINHIISELLDLTKPPELSFKKFSLQEIMDESIAMTSDRINLRNIVVNKSYPQEPLIVSANKSKLIIAFTNILINAIEAMDNNHGKLIITITATPELYSVSIKDNGKGIPEEYLSKLFEPFFTLKKNGVGLGLAASYSIIQSHKANMRVESKVNEGTNFIINFKSTIPEPSFANLRS
jgi:PAS domain S-box-containing protein